MLRLGYLHVAADHKLAARERFSRLAKIPEGMNDAVRGEAALRMAYLTEGQSRGVWAERIVAGQFKVKQAELYEAYRLAAGVAHKRDDLRRAIELYQQTPEIETTGPQRAYILKELAGLYFEVGKGEGDVPIAESARPDMYTQARAICTELAVMEGAPAVDRMVGQLMEAETWLFQGDYQTSYEHAKTFLDKYGMRPEKYTSGHQRIYVNTAKALQMQNCYFIGLHDEAEAIAADMLKNPPKKGDEFEASDSKLIALMAMKLCAGERGDQEAVAIYGSQAWQYRADYRGTEIKMQQRRAQWQTRPAR